MLAHIFGRPFQEVPNKREVWAWGMYDLANQSFTLLITTLLFAVYFREVVVADEARGVALWSLTASGTLLAVAIASPIIGAIADSRAWKKAFLVGTGLVCVGLTCALGFTWHGTIALAIALYVGANFCYLVGENFLASFLPQIATTRNMATISAFGWTMGYVGALLLLVAVAVMMQLFGWWPPEEWRPLFIFAGLWFLVFMVPTVLFLHEKARPDPQRANVLVLARRRMSDTVQHARRYRHLMRFLAAFFAYAMGVQTVIYFAAIITRDDFGFGEQKLVLFVLQLTVTAGVGALLTSRYQDRLGHRRTVLIFLTIWIVSCLGLALMTSFAQQEWLFWVLGNGIGLGLGGIGTASRALVGVFTPAHKMAEFFGLWGMVYKAAGGLGPLAFGQLKGWLAASASFSALATPLPLLLLTGFFMVGFILLLRVDEREGLLSAREAEREAGVPPTAAAVVGVPGAVLPTTDLPRQRPE